MPELNKLYSLFLNSTGITTDTRNISRGNIFFALKGEKFNANLFAAQAFEKGADYVVVDEIADLNLKEEYKHKLIIVDNVLKTLQQLSGLHRRQFNCPVLAITGSNGKTTTKELIANVLSKKFKTYATKGNLNNHIGIPLTILSIRNDAEFIVIEMGANHQGEIASYCEYVQPDYGLITNVGMAHIEGFGSFEGVVNGKTELYKDIISRKGKVFVSAESKILLDRIAELGFDKESYFIYGINGKERCKGQIVSSGDFLTVQVSDCTVRTNLVGDYNFENVMSAFCIGNYFGVETGMIREAIENYVPSNNRSQKTTYGSNTVILDAYNANPSSMIEALKNFERIKAGRKVMILGEMMELGEVSEREHRRILDMVTDENWNRVTKIFTGKGFEFLKNNSAFLWFETTNALKDWFVQQKFEDAYILIKGSRKNELEKILKD